MAQTFSFQRSDTIPRQINDTAQPTGEVPHSFKDRLFSTQPGEPDTTMSEQGWGVHGHIREQLEGFQGTQNSLINLSAELLAILATLPQLQKPGNLPEFRENLVTQVSALNNRGRLSGHSQSLMDRCCYALCAALDEGINQTSWGQQSGWENHSLLSRLFQQRNGGEIFFVLLEQARQQPDQQSELLEFIYVLLRLGFQGRYRQHSPASNSSLDLSRLCAELYSEISRIRPPLKERPHPPVSRNWRRLRLFRRTPWLILIPVLLTGGYGATAYWIHDYNTTQAKSLTELKTWSRPAQMMGAIYNSTPEDMESFSP